MFRRTWSGLPADPEFPSDLERLGYFVHPSDQVRAIASPDDYFSYYFSKNDRWNVRRQFAMNDAVRSLVHARLADLGLGPLRLPLEVTDDEPHVNILATPNLEDKSRIVVVFGESLQALGVISAEATLRNYGIDKGSMVDLVRALLRQPSSAADPAPPGVVLANPAELFWWAAGRRALTLQERDAVPLASAVHLPPAYSEKSHGIAGNRTDAEHVRYVFERVLLPRVKGTSRVDVIAVGDGADVVEKYLNDDDAWNKVGGMLGAMAILGGFYDKRDFRCDGFTRFMKEVCFPPLPVSDIVHPAPLDTLVAGPGGNPLAVEFTSLGCPVFSAGPRCNEVQKMLIEAQPAVLKWIEKAGLQGEDYVNPTLEIVGDGGSGVSADELEKFRGMRVCE